MDDREIALPLGIATVGTAQEACAGGQLQSFGHRAPNMKWLDRRARSGIDVLVIANASGGATPETADHPAFTADDREGLPLRARLGL